MQDPTHQMLPEPLALPGKLDLNHAAELHAALLEASAAGGGLNIDGTAVETVTTPCIQVLTAAAKAVEKRGASVRIRMSPPLREAIADLGLTPLFDLWTADND